MSRVFLSRGVFSIGLLGVLLVAVGIAAGSVSLWFTAFGVLVIWCGVGEGRTNLVCFTTGRCRHLGTPCREKHQPGTVLFRARDFANLGRSAGAIADRVIDAATELQSTPARGWLDPALPQAAHRLAWQVLCYLDRTRTARALALGPAATRIHGDHLRRAVEALDRRLDEAAQHLAGCAVLAREWSQKLHDTALRTQAEHELASLHTAAQHDLADTTESLLQTTFCYVTAARDLTQTGPFPWE